MKFFHKDIKRHITVNIRFSSAKKVKIGAVKDSYFHKIERLNKANNLKDICLKKAAAIAANGIIFYIYTFHWPILNPQRSTKANQPIFPLLK